MMLRRADRTGEEEVGAVVTTFRPSEHFPSRISRLLHQVGLIVIVDDGDSRENREKLKAWFGGNGKIVIQHNPQNLGIARSLNIGVHIVKSMGYQKALLLDDDTLVPSHLVSSMEQVFRNVANRERIAIVGADYLLKADESVLNNDSSPSTPYNTLTRITSGSLISLDAYDEIGPFNEDYFIDCVDYEYCLRARLCGYRIKNIKNPKMIHPIGSEMKKGFIRIRSQHSPERQYYFFRNSVHLIMMYGAKFIGFSLIIMIQQIKILIKIFFFQEEKKLRLRLVSQGVWDALKGNFGKICAS